MEIGSIVFIKDIPTRLADGTWTYTSFENVEEMKKFVLGIFKEPGKYDFDKTSFAFNEHARRFDKDKVFCDAPGGSMDFVEYWDTEREKCRKGAIFYGTHGQIWYLPRFYYHWINFLQIYRKAPPKGFHFPDVRDVQYHMALYEFLAELHGVNNVVLKKRQIASSYFHIAKLYNRYLFEMGYVGKLMASSKKYINEANGSWKFLNEYHNFTSKNTAWACINSPDTEFEWQQKVETKTPDGRKVEIGTKATITGLTLDKDPISGVGGACDEAFYEEGGVAPTANITYGYMKAAIREGEISTGIFTIAGSVGDLDQCGPIKEFIYNPRKLGFFAVYSNLIDEHGSEGEIGLFIPEQWGMPPYIDDFGNSKVEEALASLNREFEEKKRTMPPEDYQLEVSQRPRNLNEAFALRSISIFSIQHTSSQLRRIEEKEYAFEYVELERDRNNKISYKPSDRRPIEEFPLPAETIDKRSVFVIHEPPDPNAPPGTYVALIDPVEIGKTVTSLSLASIYIYRLDIEVVTNEAPDESKRLPTGKEGFVEVDDMVVWDGGKWVPARKKIERPKMKEQIEQERPKTTTHLEGGKMVAWWCGRYDDINDTNELMSMACELYNARALSENNKPSFINYMRTKRRQKYLITKDEMIFDKEFESTQRSLQTYGVNMTPKLWKALLEYAVNSLSEVLYEEKDVDGNIIKIHYGVERIRDIMLLKEMQKYQPGMNVDRIVAYGLLQGLIKAYQAAGRIRKKVERTNNKLENPTKLGKLRGEDNPLFKNIGRGPNAAINKINNKWRGGFKNLK